MLSPVRGASDKLHFGRYRFLEILDRPGDPASEEQLPQPKEGIRRVAKESEKEKEGNKDAETTTHQLCRGCLGQCLVSHENLDSVDDVRSERHDRVSTCVYITHH